MIQKKIFSVRSVACILLIGILSFVQMSKAQDLDRWPPGKRPTTAMDTIHKIIANKLKSSISTTYFTSDSSLNNSKFQARYKTLYDIAGNLIESISENEAGKVTTRTVSKFNAANYLIESITYDSLGKMSGNSKNIYNDKNQQLESSTEQSLMVYTGKVEDAFKFFTYTYKNKYDVNGNNVDLETDSAGVVISKTLSTYDAKNRLIKSQTYDHAVLQSLETLQYDSKGAYTSITESYTPATKVQCAPGKTTITSKYDTHGNNISTLSTSNINGEITNDKTTSAYKYEKDKIIFIKTITESYGTDYSSKTTSTESYKYDTNGNLLETSSKYPGGGGNYVTKYTYNKNNTVKEFVTYNGSCTDKPSNVTTYLYYPDGTTVKEERSTAYDYPSTTIYRYDKNSQLKESVTHSQYGSTRTTNEYEYWK